MSAIHETKLRWSFREEILIDQASKSDFQKHLKHDQKSSLLLSFSTFVGALFAGICNKMFKGTIASI